MNFWKELKTKMTKKDWEKQKDYIEFFLNESKKEKITSKKKTVESDYDL